MRGQQTPPGCQNPCEFDVFLQSIVFFTGDWAVLHVPLQDCSTSGYGCGLGLPLRVAA